ncbi:MAG: penicillin-binding protein activator LpoB [Candidatus Brocadia sp.]|nr:MAG: penicillin-binding protein activator LpoB [Candidatus Brocadia sp.]
MCGLKKMVIGLCMVMGAGCATNVKYKDATKVETTTADFGSTDLQQIVNKMVDSLLSFPPLVQATSERSPVIFVDAIKNKTLEHIDTESITDSVRTKILHSGKFRFVDMTKVDAAKKQFEFQNESGMVNQAAAAAFGRQIGAEYMLYGNFASIVKKSAKVKDIYYKFTLNLMELETGIIEWADEKEIRKISKRSLFGW